MHVRSLRMEGPQTIGFMSWRLVTTEEITPEAGIPQHNSAVKSYMVVLFFLNPVKWPSSLANKILSPGIPRN